MAKRWTVLVWSAWYTVSAVAAGWVFGSRYPPVAHIEAAKRQQILAQTAVVKHIESAMEQGDVLSVSGLLFVHNFGKNFLLQSALPTLVLPPWSLYRASVAGWRGGLALSERSSPDWGRATPQIILIGLEVMIVYSLLVSASVELMQRIAWPSKAGFQSRWKAYLSGLSYFAAICALCAGTLLLAAVYEATLVVFRYASGGG